MRCQSWIWDRKENHIPSVIVMGLVWEQLHDGMGQLGDVFYRCTALQRYEYEQQECSPDREGGLVWKKSQL